MENRSPRQLGRSTIETFATAILAFYQSSVHMTWGWQFIVFGAMAIMLVDLALHSPWTIQLWLPARISLACAVVALLLTGPGGDSIASKYFDAAPNGAPVPIPIAALTLADYYLDRPPIYLSLFAMVAVLVFWRFAPVARFRHLAVFTLRRTVTEQVWIGRREAFNLIFQSSWARARKSANDKTTVTPWLSVIDSMTTTRSRQSREDMFVGWCEMALRKFTDDVPTAQRTIEGKDQIDETALRQWIQGRYDTDLVKEFGKP